MIGGVVDRERHQRPVRGRPEDRHLAAVRPHPRIAQGHSVAAGDHAREGAHERRGPAGGDREGGGHGPVVGGPGAHAQLHARPAHLAHEAARERRRGPGGHHPVDAVDGLDAPDARRGRARRPGEPRPGDRVGVRLAVGVADAEASERARHGPGQWELHALGGGRGGGGGPVEVRGRVEVAREERGVPDARAGRGAQPRRISGRRVERSKARTFFGPFRRGPSGPYGVDVGGGCRSRPRCRGPASRSRAGRRRA